MINSLEVWEVKVFGKSHSEHYLTSELKPAKN